jgi:hypothetical protein
MSGRITGPAAPPKSTAAIGSPVARLLFEPQKTIATRSSLLNPSRVAANDVSPRASASSAADSPSRTASRPGVTWCQMPSVMPRLKAV